MHPIYVYEITNCSDYDITTRAWIFFLSFTVFLVLSLYPLTSHSLPKYSVNNIMMI